MMLRAVWLTIGKEFLLIRRDRVGLFMLLVAPIAVIAAAGFSLAKVYGGGAVASGGYVIAAHNEDNGEVGRAIVDALKSAKNVSLLQATSSAEAGMMVRERKLATVAIVIPASTTAEGL